SASTTRSNACRRWAIAAKAAPTPPAPTTSTFIRPQCALNVRLHGPQPLLMRACTAPRSRMLQRSAPPPTRTQDECRLPELPARAAWQVAWVGHAMLHEPLHVFDANAFYPHRLSLAFSDSLLGYGPAAWFGSGTVAALVRYNLLFLFAWSLCFVGAYLLARELGLGRVGAAAAGAAFGYAPYRVTEAGHLHVISSGGIPLAL